MCGVYSETHGADPKWIERGEAANRRALELNPQTSWMGGPHLWAQIMLTNDVASYVAR
jgi:hypothetical protein